MEDAFDLVGLDPLGTISLCWREPSKRCSLQVPSSPRLELVFAPDRTRATGVRLIEYRTPVRLFARNELHRLGLDANLLGRESDKGQRVTDGIYTYPAIILAPDGRFSDRT